jgi:hypothetical protein
MPETKMSPDLSNKHCEAACDVGDERLELGMFVGISSVVANLTIYSRTPIISVLLAICST